MNEWLNNEKLDAGLKAELKQMSEAELQDAFYQELGFGTGGMRGVVGPGTNRMNIYTLRKTNYGYANYLLKKFTNPAVAIAYDPRNKSLEFAQDSATMLAQLGIKVYLFSQITPTPVLSFAVRYLHACGGIVITASHNPPQYNGYKVYDENGCQLVPALVEELVKEIEQAPNMFNYEVGSFSDYLNNGQIEYINNEIYNAYIAEVKGIQVFPNIIKTIDVVYTPLHGTGAYFGERLLKELGYQYHMVTEQMVPDPYFSTVKSPNPEDNHAFELALTYANKYQSDVIIASDPDADRLGVCVLDKGEYKFLTGNQVGALLIYYLCNYRLFPGVLFNTVVTSDIGATIAKAYGVKVVSTLTGFKYIGEQAQLISGKEKFFFGYEESYGYVISDFVRDKDSLQALTMVCEMVNFYKAKNLTLIDVLNEIYERFGYFQDQTINLVFPGEQGAKQMDAILDYFRNNDINDLDIIAKEDYLKSIRVGVDPRAITLPKSNVIKYFLSDGSWFVLRPSGTEPKMKIYFCFHGKNPEQTKIREEEVKSKILKLIESVKL